MGRMAWVTGLRGVLGRTAGRVALHDEELRLARIARRAVSQLPGQARPVERRLAARQVARPLGRHAGPGRLQRLLHDLVGLARVLLEPLAQLLVGRALGQRADGLVAELGLGLALELRVAQAHRDDGGEALTDVLALEVVFLLFQDVAVTGVAVDDVGQRLAEPLDVHAAFNGGDAVGERVDRLVIAGVPLQRDLDLLPLLGLLERRDLAEQRLLRRVEVLHEVDDAAVVLEGGLGHRVGALVGEPDLEALVQEGHDLHALDDGLGAELRLVEDGGVGPEGHRGAGAGLARAAVLGGRPGRGHLVLELAALLELGLPVLALAVDLEHETGGQRVDHRDAHAVEAPRHLVALAAELAAGVQGREHDFGRGLLGVLGVGTDGDPGAVVGDPDTAVGQQGDVDPGGAARHGLVDRVVHHLPHQVVQAGRSGRADVHPRPLPDRFESLEDGDVGLTVGGVRPIRCLVHLHCHRRALSKPSFSRCVSNPRTVVLRPFDANAPFYPTTVSFRHS